MASLNEIPTPRNPVAYYAWLDDDYGVVLIDHAGVVSFQTEATGLWQTLTAADAPRLLKLGRCDVADAQLLRDGDRVYRCSRTLTRRAA